MRQVPVCHVGRTFALQKFGCMTDIKVAKTDTSDRIE